MTLIDWRDSRPIYEQIVDRIKHLILMDVLQPGEQLPSVRSLAMENGTNPNTVQKAYAELERQGRDEIAAGAFRVLWKMMQERRFNTNRFRAENPGVYDAYRDPRSYMKFSIV